MESTGKLTLFDFLSKITDPRKPRGVRHPLEIALSIIIIGLLSGIKSFEQMHYFIERHADTLKDIFKPARESLPSHDVLKRVMRKIDHEELCKHFDDWMAHRQLLRPGDMISLDGKALRSTISHAWDSGQKYQALVRAFQPKTQVFISLEGYDNEKLSETEVVRRVIEKMELTDCLVRMDALHCQKKQQTSSLKKEPAIL